LSCADEIPFRASVFESSLWLLANVSFIRLPVLNRPFYPKGKDLQLREN